MERINIIKLEGIYIAKNSDRSFIVKITGTAPFLKIHSVFDFGEFVKSGITQSESSEFIENRLHDLEWYTFDYVVPIESTIIQRKSDIKAPYNKKQLNEWTKEFNERGEQQCIIKIMQSNDYPLEFVQTEIIPHIKQKLNEEDGII